MEARCVLVAMAAVAPPVRLRARRVHEHQSLRLQEEHQSLLLHEQEHQSLRL